MWILVVSLLKVGGIKSKACFNKPFSEMVIYWNPPQILIWPNLEIWFSQCLGKSIWAHKNMFKLKHKVVFQNSCRGYSISENVLQRIRSLQLTLILSELFFFFFLLFNRSHIEFYSVLFLLLWGFLLLTTFFSILVFFFPNLISSSPTADWRPDT